MLRLRLISRFSTCLDLGQELESHTFGWKFPGENLESLVGSVGEYGEDFSGKLGNIWGDNWAGGENWER